MVKRNQRGITLIALVITIIVLLILAGITIAMIAGQDSAPAKAAQAKVESDKGAAKDAAILLVTEYQQQFYNEKYITNEAAAKNATDVGAYINAKLATAVTKGEYVFQVKNGLFEVSDSIGNEIATGTINSNGTITWNGEATNTENNSGNTTLTYVAYSVGDEVTVGTGANAQEFYVLEASDESQSTVTLLTKYNLSKTANEDGHYMQAPNAAYEDTACKFSSTNYWATAWNTWNSGSKETMLNLNNEPIPTTGANAEKLENNAILKARDYATAVGGTNGRLLTYEEATDGATYNSYTYKWEFTNSKKAEMIWGTANTNGSDGNFLYYWLGSAGTTGAGSVWASVWDIDYEKGLFTKCTFDGTVGSGVGVRAVITISKSCLF